ncbi:MAG: GtrA family protein [Clostridia bacterium]|nr:GtrA family protein [Clostridia bacterium]MBR2799237.1 GtrA family protein [Clostridia bacterium]
MVPYVIFGVLTTVVNTIVYWICAHIFRLSVIASSVIAWSLAVLFAYLTNRKWVFHSKAVTKAEIIREIVLFYFGRLATGAIDLAGMYIFVDIMHINDMIAKIGMNVVVIILNYIASKFFIFRGE